MGEGFQVLVFLFCLIDIRSVKPDPSVLRRKLSACKHSPAVLTMLWLLSGITILASRKTEISASGSLCISIAVQTVV